MEKSKCEHKMEFIHTSVVPVDGVSCFLDRFKCSLCDQVYAINSQTGERVDLKGLVGEEAE